MSSPDWKLPYWVGGWRERSSSFELEPEAVGSSWEIEWRYATGVKGTLGSGFFPPSMDVRWWIVPHADQLDFFHNWDADYIASVHFQEHTYFLEAHTVDLGLDIPGEEEHMIEVLRYMIDVFLLGKNTPFPTPSSRRESLPGLHQHLLTGTGQPQIPWEPSDIDKKPLRSRARRRPTPPSAPIRSYGANDEYGCFSNFSPHPVRMDGRLWPTVEHYFQAQKFAGTAREEEIRRAASPAQAKQLGNDRSAPLRRDWESVKDQVMRDALLAKFRQHDELRRILVSTGDARLIEDTDQDRYWGDGDDGRGRNRLGQLLMEVREALRSG